MWAPRLRHRVVLEMHTDVWKEYVVSILRAEICGVKTRLVFTCPYCLHPTHRTPSQWPSVHVPLPFPECTYNPEDGGNILARNFGTRLQEHML
jgi:hypothetical protein